MCWCWSSVVLCRISHAHGSPHVGVWSSQGGEGGGAHGAMELVVQKELHGQPSVVSPAPTKTNIPFLVLFYWPPTKWGRVLSNVIYVSHY